MRQFAEITFATSKATFEKTRFLDQSTHVWQSESLEVLDPA